MNNFDCTYEWLCDMMRDRIRVSITKGDKTYRGLVNGIYPESGSGNDWMVTLHNEGKNTTIYVRTAPKN